MLSYLSFWVNNGFFRNVDTIQELSDILVLNSTDLLNVSSGLGNSFNRVTSQNQFILLGRGDFDSDTFSDLDESDSLFTQEVSDFNEFFTVLFNNVDVDWEMRINVSHLVFVTLGDTGNQVSNQRLDSSQGSNVLSFTIVDNNSDLSVTDFSKRDIQVLQVLGKRTSWTGDGNLSGDNFKVDTFWDFEELVRGNVLHC